VLTRTGQESVKADDKSAVDSDSLPVLIIGRGLEILVKEPDVIHDTPGPESGWLANSAVVLELFELKQARIVLTDNIAIFIDF